MTNLAGWNYEQSVEKVRPMVMNWRNLTVEIVEELYLARKELSSKGSNLSNSPNVTDVTWILYLDEVGLNRMTVHRWLERYEPTENRLMEPEEVEQRKQIESRRKQDDATAIRKRIIEYKQTGKMPDDWDDKTEREYRKTLQEDEERKRKIAEAVQREKTIHENREREKTEHSESIDRMRRESEFLNEAASIAIGSFDKRQQFKERIKLSQSGENDIFIDALMDYLEELEDDNRRIEACQDIIKVCRNLSVDFQRRIS